MNNAERQKAYRDRQRALREADAEAGLPREAPRKRYELAYGADGRVIAWRALGSPQWVLGSGVGGSTYQGPSVGAPGGPQEGVEGESTKEEGLRALGELREQMGRPRRSAG